MPDPILTERDLEMLFSTKSKAAKKRKAKSALLYIISPFVFMVVLYIALNYNSIGQNLYYWFKFDYLVPNETTTTTQQTQTGGSIITQKPVDKYPKPDLPPIENNNLNIPALNISAPIVWGVVNKSSEITKVLPNGVAQIAGTGLPGEVSNIFITGHSSNYPWIKGNYNSIFALLNKLVAGDTIQLKYNDQLYAYKVSEIKVVQPDDVSVMYPTTEPVLTLMTCTPVGTSLRRLIIISKQIYPDPALNKKIDSQAVGNQNLPK